MDSDYGVELKGSVCRIKNCAVELFSMEDDLLIDDDEDSWDLVERDLRLKATFLYIDLSRVISSCESDERKKTLTGLANKFFYFMDEVMIVFFPLLETLWLKACLVVLQNSHDEYYIQRLSQSITALDSQIL
jgi:photosystem II oxygen-evolving enhancer protein 3